MVKPFDLIRTAKEKLLNSETPQLDAEVLLSHAINQNRISLFLNRDKEVDSQHEALFWSFVQRREHGEPIAYITGIREFMGLEFQVEPGVLIPRGDTEVLVEEIIERAERLCNKTQGLTINPSKLSIVDVGCGSGAIAVALAHFLKQANVFALDLMEKPIEMTRINAQRSGVADRLTVLRSDVFDGLDSALRGTLDIIVSNPPYIELEEYKQLMVDVRDFEPENALTDHGDGLAFYRKISEQAPTWLKPGGLLAFEIGYNQCEAVSELMRCNGFIDVECKKDLAGKDRVMLGYMK